jgi:hypothetical protein
MELKAGNMDDFEDSMASEIEKEFESAWTNFHDLALPEEGRRERHILFVAIARGVLGYLKRKEETEEIANQGHLFNNLTLAVGSNAIAYTVQGMDWNISDL